MVAGKDERIWEVDHDRNISKHEDPRSGKLESQTGELCRHNLGQIHQNTRSPEGRSFPLRRLISWVHFLPWILCTVVRGWEVGRCGWGFQTAKIVNFGELGIKVTGVVLYTWIFLNQSIGPAIYQRTPLDSSSILIFTSGCDSPKISLEQTAKLNQIPC